MIFTGISRTFSTENEEQYETIGAFWDELSQNYGMSNLRGLGYNWTITTIEYVIGLKEGEIPGANVTVTLPDSGWTSVKGRTENLGEIYGKIYEDGALLYEIEMFSGDGACEILYYRGSRGMEICKADFEDLNKILELQYLAYQSEAALFGTNDIPPLKQTLEEVIHEYRNGIILKMISEDNAIIGSVRAREENGTIYIGKLMVHPDYRGRGYGTKLLEEIEERYPGKRYELFTSTRSEANIRLYQRNGYRVIGQRPVNDDLVFVYMEKTCDSNKADVVIETERLFLREMNMGDYEALYSVLADDDIMKHYPYVFDERRVRDWIERNMERYLRDGFGLWAVCLKDTGEMIGDCGLTLQNIEGKMLPEIGYHIRRDCQRRGYAKEAAKAVMDWAFWNTGYPALYSYCKYTNEASIRTAEAIGMQFDREYPDEANGITHVSVIYRRT